MGEGSAIPTDPHHTPTFIQSSTQPQKTQKPRKPKREDTQVPQPSDPTNNVADEAVHKELGDSLVRAATTASSLEAEQDSGNITKTRSKATPNKSSSLGTTSGGGPRVLNLEKTKTTQANEIASLKRRVKKLEQKKRSRTHGLKRLRKVGATTREDDELPSYVQEMLAKKCCDVNVWMVKEVFVVGQNEILLKKYIKNFKSQGESDVDFSIAERLDKRESKKKKKPIIALIEEWDDIQVKIEVDHELAQRLRKHFAAKRAEEQRNKPPTQAQQRKIMCTYLKNMEGYKLKDLKSKGFDSIQEMFDRAFKRVNTFVNFKTDLVEGSSKRAGEELEQESTKK
ncbi:hypothetical protein Tco_1324055 [Tanacetum coccineum]